MCEDSGYDMLVCVPVLQWCRERSVFLIQQIGRNPYDFRRDCEGGVTCYAIEDDIVAYLNSSAVKLGLGVDEDFEYKLCSDTVSADFAKNGQTGPRTDRQISYLLDQVRLLFSHHLLLIY